MGSPDLKRNQTALITGASGGIGYELAKLFARDGYDLVLVARTKEMLLDAARELERKFGTSCRVMARDLTLASAPQEIANELKAESIQIDVLVNNAGYGGSGPFWQTSLERELRMIQLNIASLTHLTKLLLPGMLERRQGKILNVASTAAFQPGPLMAVYYATKAYVLSFSEAIANELKGTGVTATALCPGPTRTGFQETAGIQQTRLIHSGIIMDAQQVARIGYRGLLQGKTVVIPGFWNKIGVLLIRLAPRDAAVSFIRFVQEQRK